MQNEADDSYEQKDSDINTDNKEERQGFHASGKQVNGGDSHVEALGFCQGEEELNNEFKLGLLDGDLDEVDGMIDDNIACQAMYERDKRKDYNHILDNTYIVDSGYMQMDSSKDSNLIIVNDRDTPDLNMHENTQTQYHNNTSILISLNKKNSPEEDMASNNQNTQFQVITNDIFRNNTYQHIIDLDKKDPINITPILEAPKHSQPPTALSMPTLFDEIQIAHESTALDQRDTHLEQQNKRIKIDDDNILLSMISQTKKQPFEPNRINDFLKEQKGEIMKETRIENKPKEMESDEGNLDDIFEGIFEKKGTLEGKQPVKEKVEGKDKFDNDELDIIKDNDFEEVLQKDDSADKKDESSYDIDEEIDRGCEEILREEEEKRSKKSKGKKRGTKSSAPESAQGTPKATAMTEEEKMIRSREISNYIKQKSINNRINTAKAFLGVKDRFSRFQEADESLNLSGLDQKIENSPTGLVVDRESSIDTKKNEPEPQFQVHDKPRINPMPANIEPPFAYGESYTSNSNYVQSNHQIPDPNNYISYNNPNSFREDLQRNVYFKSNKQYQDPQAPSSIHMQGMPMQYPLHRQSHFKSNQNGVEEEKFEGYYDKQSLLYENNQTQKSAVELILEKNKLVKQNNQQYLISNGYTEGQSNGPSNSFYNFPTNRSHISYVQSMKNNSFHGNPQGNNSYYPTNPYGQFNDAQIENNLYSHKMKLNQRNTKPETNKPKRVNSKERVSPKEQPLHSNIQSDPRYGFTQQPPMQHPMNYGQMNQHEIREKIHNVNMYGNSGGFIPLNDNRNNDHPNLNYHVINRNKNIDMKNERGRQPLEPNYANNVHSVKHRVNPHQGYMQNGQPMKMMPQGMMGGNYQANNVYHNIGHPQNIHHQVSPNGMDNSNSYGNQKSMHQQPTNIQNMHHQMSPNVMNNSPGVFKSQKNIMPQNMNHPYAQNQMMYNEMNQNPIPYGMNYDESIAYARNIRGTNNNTPRDIIKPSGMPEYNMNNNMNNTMNSNMNNTMNSNMNYPQQINQRNGSYDNINKKHIMNNPYGNVKTAYDQPTMQNIYAMDPKASPRFQNNSNISFNVRNNPQKNNKMDNEKAMKRKAFQNEPHINTHVEKKKLSDNTGVVDYKATVDINPISVPTISQNNNDSHIKNVPSQNKHSFDETMIRRFMGENNLIQIDLTTEEFVMLKGKINNKKVWFDYFDQLFKLCKENNFVGEEYLLQVQKYQMLMMQRDALAKRIFFMKHERIDLLSNELKKYGEKIEKEMKNELNKPDTFDFKKHGKIWANEELARRYEAEKRLVAEHTLKFDENMYDDENIDPFLEYEINYDDII